MWDFPRPGIEPMSPALAGGLTSGPPGKPQTRIWVCVWTVCFPGGPEIILDEIIYYIVYNIQYYIHCTGGRDQDYPQEKEMQKRKLVVWGGPYKQLWKEENRKAKEKRKAMPIWMQSSKE